MKDPFTEFSWMWAFVHEESNKRVHGIRLCYKNEIKKLTIIFNREPIEGRGPTLLSKKM